MVNVVGRVFGRFPSAEVCGHVDGTTNDANENDPTPCGSSVLRSRRAGPNKKKANLARPAQGPRPLVTFPILLGTPLPGQSCRPRGTPCAPSPPPFPPATPTSLRSLFSFSAPGTGCSVASSLFFLSFFFPSKSVVGHRYSGRGIAAFFCLPILQGSRGPFAVLVFTRTYVE